MFVRSVWWFGRPASGTAAAPFRSNPGELPLVGKHARVGPQRVGVPGPTRGPRSLLRQLQLPLSQLGRAVRVVQAGVDARGHRPRVQPGVHRAWVHARVGRHRVRGLAVRYLQGTPARDVRHPRGVAPPPIPPHWAAAAAASRLPASAWSPAPSGAAAGCAAAPPGPAQAPAPGGRTHSRTGTPPGYWSPPGIPGTGTAANCAPGAAAAPRKGGMAAMGITACVLCTSTSSPPLPPIPIAAAAPAAAAAATAACCPTLGWSCASWAACTMFMWGAYRACAAAAAWKAAGWTVVAPVPPCVVVPSGDTFSVAPRDPLPPGPPLSLARWFGAEPPFRRGFPAPPPPGERGRRRRRRRCRRRRLRRLL